MSDATCKTCRFGLFSSKTYTVYTLNRDKVVESEERTGYKKQCRRFPTIVDKEPNDWCGEYRDGG